LRYRSLPKTQAQMPKPNREIAITAKGSGGSQRGTVCRWEALTSAATSAAIATPKKTPRARFGSLCQAAPHKARNSTRPMICSHIAMIEKSSRRRVSWRFATLPGSHSTSTPGRAESTWARVEYRAWISMLGPSRGRAGAAKRTRELRPVSARWQSSCSAPATPPAAGSCATACARCRD
jgi:hypothetical protein